MDPPMRGRSKKTRKKGESLGSLPTQADGSVLARWGCSGATQMDDHPTQTTLTRIGRNLPTPLGVRLPSSSPLPCGQIEKKNRKGKNRSSNRTVSPARTAKKGVAEGAPPLVDTLDYEPTPPELEEAPPAFGEPTKKRKMEADDTQKEQSARAKRRIREEGTGKEEEKKRSKRGSRAKSRPGAGDRRQGEPVSLNDKFESVVIPGTGTPLCHPTCRFPNNTFISIKHCHLSVVQRSLLGDSQGKESNDMRSLELPADDAPDSKYGVNRYGKYSQMHLGHPVDYKVVVEDMSTNGTYINETLIGKGNKSMLTHGDQLSLVMSVSNRPDDPIFDLIAYRYER